MGERASTTRMRLAGQICCACKVSLPAEPNQKPGERYCARCAPRHRVLMQFMLAKDGWSVSFLEEDCKTSIRDNTEQDCSDERRLRLYSLHLTSDQLPNPGRA